MRVARPLTRLSCLRVSAQRAGNAFLGYNNLSASALIPFLSPIIAPSARALSPLLSTIASSPARNTVEVSGRHVPATCVPRDAPGWCPYLPCLAWPCHEQGILDTLRDLSPGLLRQLTAVAAQIPSLYLDASQGAEDFTPGPEDTAALIRQYYAVPRNLLLRFKNDSVDDSNALALVLQGSPAVSQMLDLSVRTVPGDHLRPMQQALVDLPPDVARLANQAVYAGGDAIGEQSRCGVARPALEAQASRVAVAAAKHAASLALELSRAVRVQVAWRTLPRSWASRAPRAP